MPAVTTPGTFSEKIGMTGMVAVALITLISVAGMIWLEHYGKTSAQLAMIAGAGIGIIGAALKTSPDESKKPPAAPIHAGPDGTVIVEAPATAPAPDPSDGAPAVTRGGAG